MIVTSHGDSVALGRRDEARRELHRRSTGRLPSFRTLGEAPALLGLENPP